MTQSQDHPKVPRITEPLRDAIQAGDPNALTQNVAIYARVNPDLVNAVRAAAKSEADVETVFAALTKERGGSKGELSKSTFVLSTDTTGSGGGSSTVRELHGLALLPLNFGVAGVDMSGPAGIAQ